MSTCYTVEDKRVWCYCNNNYYRIKGGFNIVNSQTERRIVSTLFFDKNNFIRTKAKAIYKTRNTGTGNGMRGMRGTWGMFSRIPGNLFEDSGECYYIDIPGNVEEDSGEC